jgi:peroxiredoxin
MKFAKIAEVVVILSILGICLIAGCAKKNPDEAPLTPAEDVPDTSVTDTLPEPGSPGKKGDTAETAAEPREDPGADRRAAPDFTLADLSGNERSLSDFRGKVVLVDFWATWCRPCVIEIPHLIELYEAYKSQGFVALGVGLDKKAKLAEFARENQMSYIVLVDEKGVTGSLYAIRGIPRTLIIDKKGRIAFDHTGFAPGMEVKMEQEIGTLLAEEY